MEEGKEIKWVYYLSEKGDWIRAAAGETNQYKFWGESEWSEHLEDIDTVVTKGVDEEIAKIKIKGTTIRECYKFSALMQRYATTFLDEQDQQNAEKKDACVKASEGGNDPSVEYSDLARGALILDLDGVGKLTEELQQYATKINSWLYWNGRAKAALLQKCIDAIQEDMGIDEALSTEITSDKGEKMSVLDAIDWQRHPAVFHKNKEHTTLYDKADEIALLGMKKE